MMNITNILCPIDFSDVSQHALEQAVRLAGWFEARLTVLHVFNQVFLPVPGLAMPSYGGGVGLSAEEQERLRTDVEHWVEQARTAGVATDAVIEPGAPIPHILATATRIRADLIVMGTHGTSGFEHMVLGSVTEKVLRKAGCPVLTVPPRAPTAAKALFKQVLCAVDFSDSSVAALGAALAVAQEADAQLSVLHVLDWPIQDVPSPAVTAGEPAISAPVFDLEGYRRMLEADAAQRLATLIPAAARDWCTPNTAVVHGKPHVEVLKAAAAMPADLIVLGVRGRNAVDLMLFGSTANQVVRQAACPVLTVRTTA